MDKKSFKDAKIDHIVGMIINGIRVTVIVYKDGHAIVSIKK